MTSKSMVKGLTAGLVGGLAAAWVMNQFQSMLGRVIEGADKPHGAQAAQTGAPQHGVAAELQERGVDDENDNAAERTANFVAAEVFDQKLSEREKHVGGEVAHYIFGAATGAIYGAATEVLPGAAMVAGLPFGAAVWFVADEVVVPTLGLSKSHAQYPIPKHAGALASHLVYGVTTEVLRRLARRAL